MAITKLIGMLVSIGAVAIVAKVIYTAGKTEVLIDHRVIVPEELVAKVDYYRPQKKFDTLLTSMIWPNENERAMVYTTKENPCQLAWLVTTDTIKAENFHRVFQLTPSTCDLNAEQKLVVNFKLLEKISRQIDFRDVEFVQLQSPQLLTLRRDLFATPEEFIESVVGRKLADKGNGKLVIIN